MASLTRSPMRARNSVLMVGWKRSASGLPIASRPSRRCCSAVAERHERSRADLDRAGAEQVIALAVADLAAARPAGLEQRLEHFQLGAPQHRTMRRWRLFSFDNADCAVGGQQQQPFRCAEVLAQRRFQRVDHAARVARRAPGGRRGDGSSRRARRCRAPRRSARAGGFRASRSCRAAPHLALDQRDRRSAAAVGQLELGEQRRVALEEVGIALQVVGDGGLFQRIRHRRRPTGCLLMAPR